MAVGYTAHHLAVLGLICRRLAGADVLWALTGSLSFALQGVNLIAHDIDLQTDQAGAYEIERRLAAYVTCPVAFRESDQIRSHFGALTIDGLPVEIMGDIQKRNSDGSWEPPVDLALHRQVITVGEMAVPVLSLAYEAEAYLKLGRIERANQLRAYIER